MTIPVCAARPELQLRVHEPLERHERLYVQGSDDWAFDVRLWRIADVCNRTQPLRTEQRAFVESVRFGAP